jgi:hypothetical protein
VAGHLVKSPDKVVADSPNIAPERRCYMSNTNKNAATSTANQTNVRTMNIVSRRIPQHTPRLLDCYCPLGSWCSSFHQPPPKGDTYGGGENRYSERRRN